MPKHQEPHELGKTLQNYILNEVGRPSITVINIGQGSLLKRISRFKANC